MFQSIEEAIELPGIREGFDNIDQFIARAQSVLQRRKVRSGRSLELHVRQIFREEDLAEGRHFSHGADSEPGSKPDFLFPSQASYRDPGFPESKLRMLAVKTTCKDRWRQVLREADRIQYQAPAHPSGGCLGKPVQADGRFPCAVGRALRVTSRSSQARYGQS